MLIRRLAVVFALCAAASLMPVAAPAAGPAGLNVTINAPSTSSAGTAFTVSGFVVAYAQAPVYFEYSRGLSGQTVEILVDGAAGVTATTNAEGFYQASIAFGPNPPTSHTLQAVAFRGTLLETSSPVATTAIDRFLISLWIEPATASVAPGGTVSLRAMGEFNEGRPADVTEQVSWTSADPAVASVSNGEGTRGVVTGVAPGTTTISASAQGLTASATVSVA